MNEPAVLPRLTWRVVWFSLFAAALSLAAALLAPLFDHRALRGSWAVGIIVGSAGFQVANARRLFLLNHPGEVRAWMRPATVGLYAIALLFVGGAAWSLFHR